MDNIFLVLSGIFVKYFIDSDMFYAVKSSEVELT